MITGCFQSGPTIRLWFREHKMTFMEASEMFRIDDWIREESFLPISEATGIDIETFYQSFKQATDPPCLQTPKMLWSGPYRETPSP